MRKKSTRLKIAFFGLLLIGFIVIQYSWVSSLYKDKWQEFQSLIVSGIDGVGKKILFSRSHRELTNTDIANRLHRSFSSIGLNNIHFEFSIALGDHHLASPGFHQQLITNSRNHTFYYLFQQSGNNKTSEDLLIVVVPFLKKMVWKEMIWVIAASLFLTIMIMAIFCYAFILGERRQQLFYDSRTNALRNMMKQLETPLSTVSVAAEALRNARVMHDSRKINYYQQIITEENQRMNEQVKKFMRDIE
jgi:two-component system, OmpR family, phosphate regulon sensor histidine kinase PhoR